MTAERLSWDGIKTRYPDQWVGLTDVEWKNASNVESAVVKYTDKTSSVQRPEGCMSSANQKVLVI